MYKKYIVPILIGLLMLALVTAGVFGYMWGKSSAEIRSLKQEKKEYLRFKAEQDSIIEISQEQIEFLSIAIDSLTSQGVTINANADNYKTNVRKEKQKLHKDIDAVPNLSVSEQLKLFSRQSEEYQPGR